MRIWLCGNQKYITTINMSWVWTGYNKQQQNKLIISNKKLYTDKLKQLISSSRHRLFKKDDHPQHLVQTSQQHINCIRIHGSHQF